MHYDFDIFEIVSYGVLVRFNVFVQFVCVVCVDCTDHVTSTEGIAVTSGTIKRIILCVL